MATPTEVISPYHSSLFVFYFCNFESDSLWRWRASSCSLICFWWYSSWVIWSLFNFFNCSCCCEYQKLKCVMHRLWQNPIGIYLFIEIFLFTSDFQLSKSTASFTNGCEKYKFFFLESAMPIIITKKRMCGSRTSGFSVGRSWAHTSHSVEYKQHIYVISLSSEFQIKTIAVAAIYFWQLFWSRINEYATQLHNQREWKKRKKIPLAILRTWHRIRPVILEKFIHHWHFMIFNSPNETWSHVFSGCNQEAHF